MGICKPDSGERFIRTADSNTAELTGQYYVPQGNKLMSGTAREVVSFADRDSMTDDNKIAQALKIACADEFISGLENGIDTVLGERGTGLSEGQMQRLAIARAVFSGSPVLILDESTSALDAKTESTLLTNLKNMTDKTILIVSHRAAVGEICSRVISIRNDGI